MVVRRWQNHQLGVAPESAISVSTPTTGSHARDGVVTLREIVLLSLPWFYCLS